MAKNILNLNHTDAKKFFLTQEVFSNIELPDYFVFKNVLSATDKAFKKKVLDLSDLNKAKEKETINHILYGNKDGKYAWRKYQIINPLLYVSLVNIITEKDNWKFLQNCFNEFQKSKNIRCESMPVIPTGKRKQKAAQITQWVNNVEKKSISLALDYKFIYHTDISSCYGSIYTHSLPWAIHTKKIGKEKRGYNDLFGNKIDCHLQAMNNGQTNGIPEGSSLMDFVAEIVLGYADCELSKKLNKIIESKKYFILRYRDDYRIFVNDISDGDIILKSLSEVLLDLGFRLNTNKTCFNQDIIGGSIKDDKVDSLKYGLVPKKLSKTELLRQLLIIQQIGKKFPNSGILKNRLSKIIDVVKSEHYKYQEKTITGILIDIGYNNPNCFPFIAGLMSDYIPKLSKQSQLDLLVRVQEKIGTLSNAGLLEIWIQRIALGLKLKLDFDETLCKYAYGDYKQKIFTNDWISGKTIKDILSNGVFVNRAVIDKIKPKIERREIQVFSYES